MKRKLLAGLLSLAMIFSLVPMTAFAEGTTVTTEDALRAAIAAGDTITLGGDIAVTSTLEIPAGKTVSIDLAGYDIENDGSFSSGNLIHVANTAVLNITDSSDDEDGAISFEATGNSNTVWVEGVLNLYSGTISFVDGTYSGISYAVDVHPSAWGAEYTEDTEFNMYGGLVYSYTYGVRVASYSSESYENISVSFTMEDGAISSGYAAVFVQQPNETYDKLTVEIKDGDIDSYYQAIQVYGPAATGAVGGEENPMNITVSGGNFEGDITVSDTISSDLMDFAISGGTFTDEAGAEPYIEAGLIIDNNGTVVSCTHESVKDTDYTEKVKPSCTAEGEAEATCAECGTVITKSIAVIDHADENNDEKCDECGANLHEHNWSDEFKTDHENHWRYCKTCKTSKTRHPHVDVNNDGSCDACDYRAAGVSTGRTNPNTGVTADMLK